VRTDRGKFIKDDWPKDLRASLRDLDAKHENFLDWVGQFVPRELLPPDFHK
jgi:hypothetical protein